MQASKLINDVNFHLQWIDIISKVKITYPSLDQFIQAYQNNKEAFIEFPFDTPVLIKLVQRMHPPTYAKESPFMTFIRLNQVLNLDPTQFFEQFHSIFRLGIKNRLYEKKDVAELFTWIKSQDQLFGQYFNHYSSNANPDHLWDMFLHLFTIGAVDKIVQKHLIPIVSQRALSVNTTTFQRYVKIAKNSLGEIKPDHESYFLNLFEKIFYAYIIKWFTNPQYSYQLTRIECIDLLQAGLQLSFTDLLER
ncbi:unnamed protein product [Rotaria sp. Silwood2]|nr:unnamed protein product [Rotaria sp. Silwood2]